MGIISTGPGSPLTNSTASGGKLYAYNALDAVTPQQIAPGNPQRQTIVFHNPGAVDILIYPAIKYDGSANSPSVAAPGGAFHVFSNGGTLTITGECQTAWYALALTGSTGALTVMDSNV